LSELRPAEYYLHLVLYNVVYILPLAAVVALVGCTLFAAGGCYLLLFRVQDTAKGLALKVGETRFALFKDCEILEILKPEN